MEINFSENKIKLPKINLKELEEQKAKIFKERLEFIDKYVEYIKNTNKK